MTSAPLRLAINGASGRMGQALLALLRTVPPRVHDEHFPGQRSQSYLPPRRVAAAIM